jgi:hypothetical protein
MDVELLKISVWTIEGYEGRFLEWQAEEWRAVEYHNFRHSFGPSETVEALDLKVLRETFDVPVAKMSDSELVRTSPAVLKTFSANEASDS